jgi:glycosyltransferase involved in cell wall biosynthesis
MGVGGAERQYYVLMNAVRTHAWRPVLVTLNGKGRFFDDASAAGVECHYLAVPSWRLVRGLRRLHETIAQSGAEVILARGFTAATLARLVTLVMRAPPPVIVAEHSTGPSVHQRWYHALIERMLIPLTTRFVAVANNQLEYLVNDKKLPPSRIDVIHNGIEFEPYLGVDRMLARRFLGIPDHAFVVGIVAALRPEKDHLTFLQAASLLDAAAPGCWYLLAGEGPMRSRIEGEIERLGMRDHVLMLGTVEDVSQVYAALDVFTLSSNTVETLPMAGLEAMGSAVSVVATAVGGVPELVDDGVTGVLVPPNDPEALFCAWKSLYDDRALCYSMGQAGRKRAMVDFSAERMGVAYVRLFDRLAPQSSVSEGGA